MNAPVELTLAAPEPFAHLCDAIEKTRLPPAQASQLPGELYCSKQVAQLEKDRIFLHTWLCIGREEQIPNPGDYFTQSIAGEPFIVSRDDNGNVSAFLNMCLHRGVPVASGHGNARGFRCPYHAWNYDIKGNLRAAPYMGKSTMTSTEGYRLKPIQLQLWRGWIFISFNDNPLGFTEFIEPYERELWWFRTEQCRSAEKVVLEVNCNWKLLVENLIDIYHVPVIHKTSFGSFLKTDRNAIEFELLPRGGWIYEQEARPHSKDGEPLFPILPWLEGMSSSTSIKAGIFPNLNLSLRADSLRMWQVWPVAVDKTEIHLYSLFPYAVFERPDFQTRYEEYKDFIVHAITDEDGPMVVELQKAVNSRFYKPGQMSHLEGAVHHLMNYYLDAMGAPA
ncbi:MULTISPECIES: aromatic ring-hydroxylating dioxygenase subunit alpha [unclassified Pigmentiphaga]|uniref:aromatic ring-hydroxylating oxygenase subunit alpha n=1 Tax=unclassified Pigmentiphaga TaxID=2626614 RepID=UPI000B40D98E|nr:MULTISPECIES: aromatic ring-hydroxylating dioxygenase subunit alpha [unclassified Pigmentiphaga]OVZ66436.1 ring-hydroxylating oxygenase subunit alpha [Pigmentiphaga sp. NML030171]